MTYQRWTVSQSQESSLRDRVQGVDAALAIIRGGGVCAVCGSQPPFRVLTAASLALVDELSERLRPGREGGAEFPHPPR